MKELLRSNIANLKPYSCARNDFTGEAEVYLDANENWRDFVGNENRNRYPDPLCTTLRRAADEILKLPFANTVVGNGSDEVIDNLFRCFCRPGKDSALLMPPTYGAYRVFADINDVAVKNVPLTPAFELDLPSLEAFLEEEKKNRTEEARLKLIFICSPNNPTGNAYALEEISRVCSLFDGITVVDEAYFDFSPYESAITLLDRFPNLVVLRTLSKCWALANARIGFAIASEEICSVLNSMKYPYNVGGPSQELALRSLTQLEEVKNTLLEIEGERTRVQVELASLKCVETVFHSDANFFLVRVTDADKLYHYLAQAGIIVRNRSKEMHCENCLRITIGSKEENDKMLSCLAAFEE